MEGNQMHESMLFELLTEELPPKSLLTFQNTLKAEVEAGLRKHKLNFFEVVAFSTPRRLALLIRGLETKQADCELERKGPALAAAYDEEGKPTKAALGFAKSCGINLDQASTIKTEKGEWLFYKAKQKGKQAKELLPELFQAVLKKLPIPKLMTWGIGEHHFVRPVKNVLAVMDSEVVAMNLFGVESCSYTFGHRFHHLGKIEIKEPQDYAKQLLDAFVLVDFLERREQIASHLTGLAESKNADVVANDALLDEVTALVEWPNVLMGKFDEKYLQIPEEVLILSMATHQRYFALRGGDGKLLSNFILVSNIQPKSSDKIISGNEKVLHARFSDALFFFNQDKKTSLKSRVNSLSKVLFEKQLGTLWDKTQRIKHLSGKIAEKLLVNSDVAMHVAELCKTDLLTEMVGEFPELQGVMGRYYALNDGETAELAEALDGYYKPRFASDTLSNSSVTHCVALADRIDTLVGIIGINKLPTGDKDPFALRRQALAILRILIEFEYELDLDELINDAIILYGDRLSNQYAAIEALGFIEDRLKYYLIQNDVRIDVFNAASSLGLKQLVSPYDVSLRVKALSSFLDNDACTSLVSANKRVENILKKQNLKSALVVDKKLFVLDEESSLFEKQNEMSLQIESLVVAKDFLQALTLLSELKQVIDAFFEKVMVMADDEKVRDNRIALLSSLRKLFLQVADLSQLQV